MKSLLSLYCADVCLSCMLRWLSVSFADQSWLWALLYIDRTVLTQMHAVTRRHMNKPSRRLLLSFMSVSSSLCDHHKSLCVLQPIQELNSPVRMMIIGLLPQFSVTDFSSSFQLFLAWELTKNLGFVFVCFSISVS